MSILAKLDLDNITPARLWSSLDPDVRTLAARAVYRSEETSHRVEVDMTIAERLKFRPSAIRKLPVQKRVSYVVKAIYPDDDLASTLLMDLHLQDRREVLAAFLDALEIPHDNGTIDGDYDLQPPSEADLRSAGASLLETFDTDEVELYLVSLLALDPVNWGNLLGVLKERQDG